MRPAQGVSPGVVRRVALPAMSGSDAGTPSYKMSVLARLTKDREDQVLGLPAEVTYQRRGRISYRPAGEVAYLRPADDLTCCAGLTT